MNIWAWVRRSRERLAEGEAAEQRLAELMRTLPSATVNEAHEQVDALVPEAAALARELREPWAEVFVRHWGLQSRILHRRQAGEELREAVELLDFASGPSTRECPQSVCSVQDLAVCYATRDGPGYVEQRLAVARETLERIDPSWACFECISAELYSALMDDGRAQEALEFIEAQREQQAEHGVFEPSFNLVLNRARALVALGRAEEALEIVEGMRGVGRYGRARQMSHRQTRASILLAVGRGEEALELHPPLSAIADTPGHFRDWIENATSLARAGLVANDTKLGRELAEIQRKLVRNSAHWDAALAALAAAELAVAREAREIARMQLRELEGICAELRRPELLSARREAARARLEALPPVLEPPTREAISVALEASENPERELDLLTLARELDPGDTELIFAEARALRRCGWPLPARRSLERLLSEADDDTGRVEILAELAGALVADEDHRALDDLIADASAGLGSSAGLEHERALPIDAWLRLRWIHGHSLRIRGELEAAATNDRAALARVPDSPHFLRRLAAIARARGDWEEALELLERAAPAFEPAQVDWDRMTAATVLGRWSIVRAAGARLGLELRAEGDEEVVLNLGLVRCEIVEAGGARSRHWARRTSPCGARIVEIAMPGEPQHYGDVVVFEPTNLDHHGGRLEPSQTEAPMSTRRPCFEVVAILERGEFRSFLLRALDPGAEAFTALRRALGDAGYPVERITREGRTAADPRQLLASEAKSRGDSDGEGSANERPALAFLVALPPGGDPGALRELVRAHSDTWELPPLAPELDEAAGQPDSAAVARKLVERWTWVS